MPQQTQYYQLKKPLEDETYNIDDFNANFDAIDNQMHLNAENIKKKQDTITGSATTITDDTLIKDRVVITDSSGKIAVSSITPTKLGYLADVTSDIQAQLDGLTTKVGTAQATADGKVSKSGDTMTGGLVINTTYPRLDLVRNDYVHGTAPTQEKLWALARVLDNGTTKRTLMTNELKVSTSETFVYSTSVYDSNNKWHYPFVIKWAKDYSTVEVTAPTPTDKADNTDKIATTKWVNTASSVVHTTGNEAIGGNKTFTSSPSIQNTWLWFKNDSFTTGGIYSAYLSDKAMGSTYMRTYNSKGQNTAIVVQLTDDGVGTGYAPTTPSTATSNEIATANWSLGKFVQKSGDTMTGNLFIEASSNRFVYIKRADLDRDVEQVFPTSGTTTVGGFIVVDKDGGAIGGINRAVSPSEVSVTLQNSQTVNGTLRHCNLSLKIAKDGSMYATVPTPSDSSDNSTKIATTEWVNSADSVVHKTGNETVAGTKTFTSNVLLNKAKDGQFTIKAQDVKRGTTPNTNTTVGNFRITDGANATLGEMRSGLYTDGSSMLVFSAVKNQTSRADASIVLGWKADGTQFATAPRTPDGAVADEIATANWTIGKFVGLSGNQNIDGVKTFTSSPIVKFANETSVTLQRASVDNDNTYFTYGRFIIKNDTEDKGIISAGGTSNRTRVAITNKLKGVNSEIAIEHYSDGRTWATAPSPPLSQSALRNITISTSAPSGGNNGDLWAVYEE